jgi:hypothetical protein
LNFLEKWELINDKPLDLAVELFEKDIFEDFLKDWSNLHSNSFQNDKIWEDNAGLPVIPTSGTYHANPDLIANVSLYNDRQIIQDPIDKAIEITGTNPVEHLPRFSSFLKRNLQMVLDLQPLFRENLVELMPYQFLVSKFSEELDSQLNKDYIETGSLKYIEEKMKWKVYPESNILAFRVGDLNLLLFERYGIFDRSTMKETENGLFIKTRIPSNLKGVKEDEIEKWVHGQFHKHSSQIANIINERLLLAELFSGSIATNEIVTYEFIKSKSRNLTQKEKEPIISVHPIPILGKVDLEKFIEFRSNELPSFISFREEWNEGKGILKSDVLSNNWVDKLNNELKKCNDELNKNKKTLFEEIAISTRWAGLGIGVGVLAGALFSAAFLTGLIPLTREIKDAWSNYLQNRISIEAGSPFFLLNVIDEKTDIVRTDIPRDLPEKMELAPEAIKSSVDTLEGAPFIFYDLPQTKSKRKESTKEKEDN